MFVQLAGSTGSVTKGSVQSFRAMAMPMMMMMLEIRKNLGPRPGNRIFIRTIVNAEKRAESSSARAKNRRGRRDSEFFSEPSVRERSAFLPKRHVPGRALFSRERLGKAKEQEEVIRARHCYPTLGTLDRNRTWKPTTRSLRPRPPPFVPFARALLSPRCGLRD